MYLVGIGIAVVALLMIPHRTWYAVLVAVVSWVVVVSAGVAGLENPADPDPPTRWIVALSTLVFMVFAVVVAARLQEWVVCVFLVLVLAWHLSTTVTIERTPRKSKLRE